MVNICGDNVALRALVNEDYSFIFEWKNDSELSSSILAHPLAFTPEMARDWIQKNTSDKSQVLFGITSDKDLKELIGIIRLMFIDWINHNAELGVFIGNRDKRGKGVGDEVLRMMLGYAFMDLNLNRIYLRVAADNERAIGLYKKNGFIAEGILRQQVWRKGKYVDVLLMGILRSEFFKRETDIE